MIERARAGKGFDRAQAIIVVLQRLFTYDDVPAAGKGAKHKVFRACLTQLELDGMRVAHVDHFHSRKQRRTWTTKTLRRKDDAREGGVHIVSSEISPIVELHALAQEEGIGLAIRFNLPALRQVWNDRLTVQGMPPNQVVVHGALGRHVRHGTGLMHVEMCRSAQDTVS